MGQTVSQVCASHLQKQHINVLLMKASNSNNLLFQHYPKP